MFAHDALLLIGHGSSRVQGAARPLIAHAKVIRGSGRFGEVAVGMLRGEPNAALAFDTLTAPVVHVVPFFLEDGYFTQVAIPELLLPRAHDSRRIRFCQPVGLNAGIATLLERRLLRHCESLETDPKTVCVLLVGHGSSKHPGQARALRRHADTLRSSGIFGSLRVAYLEEAPTVAEALAGARDNVVLVLGYLANEGVHASRDLPEPIAAERSWRGTALPPIHDLGAIGADDSLPALIAEQAIAETG